MNGQTITETFRAYWIFVLFAGLTLLVYSNSFPPSFHYDDFPLMLQNPDVTNHFRYLSFLDQYGGRPLTLWTFHWNYRLAGAQPFSYHALNLLLHIFSGCGIYLLARRLTQVRMVAAGTALLFLLHPLQTQAVNFIWSRSILLMSFFAIAALLAAERHPLFSLLLFQLAVWSRTEAVVLALFLVLLQPGRWKPVLAVATANTLGFLYGLSTHAPEQVGWNHENAVAYWSAQPAVWAKYILLMLWPSGLTIEHDFNALPLFSLIALTGVIGISLALIVRGRWHPALVVSAGWLFAWLLPSSLVPNTDLINESRTYLAFAGFALFATWLFRELGTQTGRETVWIKGALFAIVLAALIPQTMERNALWRDDVALWKDAANKSPDKARVHYNLGQAYAVRYRTEEAEKAFRRSRELNPDDDLSYAALGYCAELRGENAQARSLYRQAVAMNPLNDYALDALRRLEHGSSSRPGS